jgi:ubiquinone/menaquinone biosynthesis C-methylase UbiE
MNETTVSYYDSLADVIHEKYPQGYQVALIKNEDYGSLGLREQNYEYLARLGELNHDSFIADVGCGNGQFHKFLRTHPNYKNCNYVGVDCCEKQIQNASKLTENNSSSFFCINMNEFFSSDPYFDVMYFIESIGYTTDLDTLIKSISTGLKIGGKVVIKNPIKVVHDEELDLKYKEEFFNIEKEYGYDEKSLGMLPEKTHIETKFTENGFEVEKIEVPDIDVMSYNETFLSTEELVSVHPSYIQHISQRIPQRYEPNKYHECMIFVFKKVAEIINDTKELPFVQQRYDQYTQDEPMDKVIQRSIQEKGIDIMDPLSLELYRSNPAAAAAAIQQSVKKNPE